MPTISQLVKNGRTDKIVKSKSPSLNVGYNLKFCISNKLSVNGYTAGLWFTLLSTVKEKKYIQWHLLKHNKGDFIQGWQEEIIKMCTETTNIEYWSGGERQAQLCVQLGQEGIYGQRVGWETVDGILLKGNIRNYGNSH